ncbi:MAG: MFS transporter [Armatimonadetes bacterium]|nr:MFS transporter [Armatimonadota bacterium]
MSETEHHGIDRPAAGVAPAVAAAARTRRLSSAFGAPGYLWLWLNSLSTSAAWTVETLGQGWLLLHLTDSAFWVGVGAGVRGAAQLLFSIPAGALADRVDRRRLLQCTHGVAALGALVLAVLIITRAVKIWHVLAFVGTAGLVNAANRPAASGLIYEVVGERRLLNASALLFMAASLVRIAGAIAGGFVIDRLGIGPNYLAASVVHVGAVVSLSLLKMPARARPAAEPFFKAVMAGLSYSLTRRVRNLMVLSVFVEAFGFSYHTMIPVMARDVLKVGAVGLGYLTSMSGIGQLLATMLVASRGEVRNRGELMVGGALGLGVAVLLFGLSPWFLVSLMIVTFAGAMSSTYDAAIFTVLQTQASDEMRGRVLGLYYATIGFNQLGGFGVGALATLVGVPGALMIGGSIAAVSAFALLPSVRGIGTPAQSGDR